ncbi:cytochrome P450 [Amycolatopsis sp. FDAARGOS 1241]|uniref:cytochrome P450 n=1 Tax=Amycolatopsis sp. FDAARGOS 1241 TaxID=2778070 RepID=UPI00194F9546|nr:cytochrome P450 [Amycolatopsis sp. FDAARGOS 1241]QRP42868.1 cytochrome P450 [Amycolatopsis sp. FDAARGOS 1241]
MTHDPYLFANYKEDPVNGEINVREFLGASMMYVEGDSHRTRRKLLNPLVRADALSSIREDVVLPEADRLLALRLAEPGPDGKVRFDLVEFLERVFVHFTAKLIGLVGMDTDERIARMVSFAGPIAAGTSSGYLEDRDAVNEKALDAKARYVAEFFRPSLEWHKEQRRRIDAGEIAETDVPDCLLKMAAAGLAPEWTDEDKLIVESTLLFAASVGTSTQSVIQTIDLLQGWFIDHPEDLERRTDPTFLLHSLQEIIRMRAPFAPYQTRLSLEENTLSDGTPIHPNQELHIEYVLANRDREIFGADADEFNPNRPAPSDGTPRYGVGFGLGAHQCYGLRVVVGNDGKGGAHVELLRKLLAAGVRPDPDNPPVGLKKDMSKYLGEDIPRYVKYFVVVDR